MTFFFILRKTSTSHSLFCYRFVTRTAILKLQFSFCIKLKLKKFSIALSSPWELIFFLIYFNYSLFFQIEGEVARSVTEAIAVLSNDSPTIDRHPEKRVKAAYAVWVSFKYYSFLMEKFITFFRYLLSFFFCILKEPFFAKCIFFRWLDECWGFLMVFSVLPVYFLRKNWCFLLPWIKLKEQLIVKPLLLFYKKYKL